MTDINKVIDGLEHCRKYGLLGGVDCNGHFEYTDDWQCIIKVNEHRHDCPYGKTKTGCVVTLIDNVIELLKEQRGYVSVPFSWLVKFCAHIDFKEPLTDEEREKEWKRKLKQQFGIDLPMKTPTAGDNKIPLKW